MEKFSIDLLTDKVLNITKIMELQDSDRKLVIDLFYRIDDILSEIGKGGGISFNHFRLNILQVIYNTLTEEGYLISNRESRIDKILK